MEHYLYTIEFIVQNLKVTKVNECAPAHYPYYAEFRFRRGLYLSIHQKNFGSLAEPNGSPEVANFLASSNRNSGYSARNYRDSEKTGNSKQGRGCAFVLDRDVDDSDIIDVRVYKKSSDKCKFLIGTAEIPIKMQFQSAMEKFASVNSANYPNGIQMRFARGNYDKQSKSPFDPVPYEKDESKTEAAIGDRNTYALPADHEPIFKWEKEKNEMGIVSDENPPQPDKPAAITFKVSIQLRSQKGDGAGFLVILVRLTCMGRSLCKEIPYPKRDDECKSDSKKSKDGYNTEATTVRKAEEYSRSRSKCSYESDSNNPLKKIKIVLMP